MTKRKKLEEISWEDFTGLSPVEKAPYFLQRNGTPYHVLVSQQFDRPSLDGLCRLATHIRQIAKSRQGVEFLASQLSHKRAMLEFTQPSSRTFLSFSAACQILGLRLSEVRDPATSSEVKGESREDTVRTISSYFDLIVMRSPEQGFAEKMAWILSNAARPVPIVNAGSGKDQHPTQALLDIYTLQRSFEKNGGIDGKSIMFVGDLLRGRTVRSLALLLTKYKDVKQYFVGPDQLQISPEVTDQLDALGIDYEISSDFEDVLPKADAVYMTRIQDEWDKKDGTPKERIPIEDFYLTPDHLDVLKKQAIIMHPLPRRKEIDTQVDLDPRAMYWRQVRNGMWVRAALIATIFDRHEEISRYYRLNYR